MDVNMDEVDEHAEWLLPDFGDPEITPRVGVEYQAKIPAFMKEYEPLQIRHFDLSIPVMWVRDQPKTSNEEAMRVNFNGPLETNDASKSAKGKVDISGSAMNGGKKMNVEWQDKGLLPVPGSLGESWSVIERDSFLLGLYLFGKNLRLVNKFMGNKGMGNLMCYYYGEFYRSLEHCRWSKWRKARRKKPKNREKIFTGWKHHELLSRLSSNVTDECKSSLMEAGRMYTDGYLSFEEFVFTLKYMVGMNLLVEAVAIGKEKRDLLESMKNSSSSHARHEVPTGKACSALTTQEIVRILKGDVRLSKARSSDLFWEAVWPRLLARGWHSEQPRNYALQNSKNCLVFLVPGVTEFSRRELEKGIHYFDSLTDVLSKVALEPELLKLESDEDKQQEDPDMNQDSDDQQQDCHLQPHIPQCNQDLKKFTIVDTSLVLKEDGVVKMIKLVSLPVAEPAHITEQQPDEQDVTESSRDVFGSPDHESSTVINDLANRLDPKRCESYSESKPDDTSENYASQEKPPSGDDKYEETIEEPCSEKNPRGILIDLNLPHVTPDSDTDESSLSPKPTTKQPEFSDAGASMVQQPVIGGQRHSTRNRPLTTKALEALACGFLSPKKKRKGAEEKPPRRVRGKTALVSSCGAGNVEKGVDGVFSGATHMVCESPK